MTKRREQATTESRGALTIMFDSIAGEVADLVRAAGDRFVLPRYGVLADEDIATKTSPTDLVTVADREAEAWLTPRLRGIVDAVVIGEEACGEDPALREHAVAPLAWTIDPVDGTNNFVKAKDRFCSMVALLENGVPVRSWIWLPLQRRLYYAAAGEGAIMRLDDGGDHRLSLGARDWHIDMLNGAASVRDVEEPEKTRLRGILREMPGRWFPGSIGVLAGGIAEGSQHFLMHASCTPWDHAPVDLLCREAGAHAAMIDGGGRYNAGNRSGIMIAPDAAAWHMLHRHLWEDGRL